MDRWLLIVIFLVILVSVLTVYTRVSGREEKDLKNKNLSADDFEIIE